MTDNKRYFVVTLGRSGSSLLCALMADAGADFGQPAPADWDRRRGILEHPDMKRAAHHMRRAYDNDAGERYLLLPQLEAKWRRHAARGYLLKALNAVTYVKIGDLDLLVQLAFSLGFEPRVIVSFRRLESTLASMLIGRKHHGPDALARDYVRVYRQGYALMRVFGGCAISYERMADVSDTGWLDTLAAVAPLSRTALAEAAALRVEGRADGADAPDSLYPDAQAVFAALRRCEGQVFEPVRQVMRALTSR